MKKISNCLDIIEFYESLEKKDITFCNYEKRFMSTFSKKGNKFLLETEEEFDKNNSTKNPSINNSIYEISKGLGIKIKGSHFKSKNYFNTSSFNVYEFCSISNYQNKEKGFYRLIMNHTKEHFRMDFYFNDVISIKSDTDNSALNGVEFKVENKNIQSYISDKYFIIESCQEIEKESFIKICRCFLASFSFITGYAPGNYAFIFEYENDKYTDFLGYDFNSSFSESIDKSSYSHVDSNIYNYCIDYSDNERKYFVNKYKSDFKGINKNSLSEICNKIMNDHKFSDAIFSILEARTSSLISMGVLYSVSLESLSSTITEQETEKTYYIKNKKNRKELQKLLILTASNYFEENLDIPFESSPIQKRLQNINSDTNMNKLLVPFEILSIPLLDDDSAIINHRNDFLHGNIINDRTKDFDSQFKDLWYIALRLSFLVNALVLKSIGHSGKIRNVSGLLLKKHAQKTYRDI